MGSFSLSCCSTPFFILNPPPPLESKVYLFSPSFSLSHKTLTSKSEIWLLIIMLQQESTTAITLICAQQSSLPASRASSISSIGIRISFWFIFLLYHLKAIITQAFFYPRQKQKPAQRSLSKWAERCWKRHQRRPWMLASIMCCLCQHWTVTGRVQHHTEWRDILAMAAVHKIRIMPSMPALWQPEDILTLTPTKHHQCQQSPWWSVHLCHAVQVAAAVVVTGLQQTTTWDACHFNPMLPPRNWSEDLALRAPLVAYPAFPLLFWRAIANYINSSRKCEKHQVTHRQVIQ